MLLSINEAKVAELLKSSNPVFTANVPIVENCRPPYPTTPEVSGTVYTAPLLATTEARERLMAARGQIEQSGLPLKSIEELTKEIDEMRGRR